MIRIILKNIDNCIFRYKKYPIPEINDLIKNILRNPFSGIGKPEQLKSALSGYWSRRITKEHRLVYKVLEDEIIIISCKYHYDN